MYFCMFTYDDVYNTLEPTHLLYQESYCIEAIVHLDVALYPQSVLLSHWKVTIQCVVDCYLTCSTN